MSVQPGTSFARRRLVPRALLDVFEGQIPATLTQLLNLPSNTRFEALRDAWFDLGTPEQDRKFLDQMVSFAGPALSATHFNRDVPAFPFGLSSELDFSSFQLSTRTWNCLDTTGLLSRVVLAEKSIADLLAIPAFGAKCLLDLLTAVDVVNIDPDSELASRVSRSPPGFAYRSIVPEALRDFLVGVVPSDVAKEFNLEKGVRFEELHSMIVKPLSHKMDRYLLDNLTKIIAAKLGSLHFDIPEPAFPSGVPLSLSFERLPLTTRTRNCLVKSKLLNQTRLAEASIADLLAIPAFGLKCLVDLLSAVEGCGQTNDVPRLTAPARPKPKEELGTLSPRLTREARLLGSEPWAKDVSIYDVRLGMLLLKDAASLTEVYERLISGLIPMSLRLCIEPPRRELDLLRCPLLTRTANRLREAGLTTISSVAGLTIRELACVPGLTDRSVADLLTVLDVCRFPAALSNDGDCDPTLADFCESVVNRARDAWFPDRLADRIHQTRSLGIQCLSVPLEEELRNITTSLVRHSEPVIQYLGWDGLGQRTLEAAGTANGLTRERVRQLAAHVTDHLSAASVWTPILHQALDFVRSHCPRPANELASMLQQKDFSSAPFQPYGLATFADAIRCGQHFALARFGDIEWAYCGDQLRMLEICFQFARSSVSSRAVCSVIDVQAEVVEKISHEVSEETVRECLSRFPKLRWLGNDRAWFRFGGGGAEDRRKTGNSSLETILWKIMSVAPVIQIGELREGLMRHHRSPSAPPTHVLKSLCDDLGLIVKEHTVSVTDHVPYEEVLSEAEMIYLRVFQDAGPLLPTTELEKRCTQLGMNRSTFWVYLTYSPILAQFAPGVYGLRGAIVNPGDADSLKRKPSRARVVEDFGWKGSSVAWIAYTVSDSVLRSGVVGMPSGMRTALGDGSWPLYTLDNSHIGTLVSRGGSVWGLIPFLNRRGAESGDVAIVEIDKKNHSARVRLGGRELLEQARSVTPELESMSSQDEDHRSSSDSR